MCYTYNYAKHNNVILILCQRCAGVAPQIGHSPALDRANTDPVGETSHQHQLAHTHSDHVHSRKQAVYTYVCLMHVTSMQSHAE